MGHYREALRLYPRSFEPHNHFSNALLNAGRLHESIDEFRASLAIRPDDAELHNTVNRQCASCKRGNCRKRLQSLSTWCKSIRTMRHARDRHGIALSSAGDMP